MDKILNLVERIAPESIELISLRYQILRLALHNQPVGRRQLSKVLHYSERIIRSEVDILKARGALYATSAGICITDSGHDLLNEIDEIIPYIYNTQTLSIKIKQKFGLQEVIVVPGDSYTDAIAKKDLGRAAAKYLNTIIYSGCILAVTGGTTLAEIAAAVSHNAKKLDILVVPARGGLGEDMEQQAGVIAARIAQGLGGNYRLLHIPDNLEENTAQILRQDLHVREVVNAIKSADILIHGIGSALEMAARRNIDEAGINWLLRQEAVGEMLRYYFDKWGKIVWEIPGIGLELENLSHIPKIVAVAGGSNKAQAISAVLNSRKDTVLITDEGAAQLMAD